MDKKKIFGIPLLLGVVAIIVWLMFDSDPKAGNKFEATVQSPESVKVDSINDISLYVDFSGSMRGYIDFAGIESGKNIFISTVTSMLDNLESQYNIASKSKCGNDVYHKDQLRLAMQNKKIFNEQTTSIQNMINEAKSMSNGNSLSIVVSDMIMSWGKKKIIESKDTFYNKTQIDGLGAAIHSEMKAVKSNGLDVMMVQYLSDYNGRYYCNYTENVKSPDKYKSTKMEKRPFYIFFIGKANLLKDILFKYLIKDYANIYTSFDVDKCSKTVPYKVTPLEGDRYAKLWFIGDAQNPDDLGTIWTTDNLNDSQATFIFKCGDFVIPPYCYTRNTKLSAVSEPDVFSAASVDTTDFSVKVTLKPFNMLKTGDVELCVICNNNWIAESSTYDDINEDHLEGKTWGLAKIIETIDAAFYPQGRNYNQVVGIYKFRIQK